MIDSLTAEQEARLPEFRQKWLAIGLSTEPADRPRAEAAVKGCYAAAGIEPPRNIVWSASPREMALAFLRDSSVEWDSVRPSVEALVEASVRDLVGYSVVDWVQASVWASVKTSVWDSVWDSGWSSVMDFVRGSVRASVWDSVMDGVIAAGWSRRFLVWNAVRDAALPHEMAMLGFYDYFRAVGLQQETEPLVSLLELAQSAGWAIPCRDTCWICERPSVLHLNQGGLLHNLTGPALAYPDGWSTYAVHGTRVPAEWIEQRETLDPRIALTWPLVEQRRAAAELIGWKRILEQLDARTVQADHNPQIGTLLEVEIEGRRERFLRVQCGTGRDFVLPVPPELRTAAEANAWTYGLEAAELSGLEART